MSIQESLHLTEPNSLLTNESKLDKRMKINHELLSLSDEILLKIFSNLNILGLKKCAQVSKRLQRVALDSSLDYSDNLSMPSLYEKTLCLCVKKFITGGKYKKAKDKEVKKCFKLHCKMVKDIWDQIIYFSENSFGHLTYGGPTYSQPMEQSKKWHTSVKFNEREHLVHRL